jgi:hypothetical protein
MGTNEGSTLAVSSASMYSEHVMVTMLDAISRFRPVIVGFTPALTSGIVVSATVSASFVATYRNVPEVICNNVAQTCFNSQVPKSSQSVRIHVRRKQKRRKLPAGKGWWLSVKDSQVLSPLAPLLLQIMYIKEDYSYAAIMQVTTIYPLTGGGLPWHGLVQLRAERACTQALT